MSLPKNNLFAIKSKHFQYVIYDSSSFFADVGGYLGLLLGHSLFSVYTMVEERAMFLIKKNNP